MQGIDTSLSIEIPAAGGLGLPALQVTNYRPASGQEVPLCLSLESAGLLHPNAFDALGLSPETVDYGGDPVDMLVLSPPHRWVILGQPRMMMLNKSSKEVLPLKRGALPQGHVTATRLFLLAFVGDELLIGNDGQPQIFTLKLTSNKTRIVAGTKGDRSGSVAGLNDALLKHYKMTRRSLVHLCSLTLTAQGQKFTSSRTGESSVGVMYTLSNAKPLSSELQAVSASVAGSEFIQGLLRDPFGQEQQEGSPSLDVPVSVDEPVDVPF